MVRWLLMARAQVHSRYLPEFKIRLVNTNFRFQILHEIVIREAIPTEDEYEGHRVRLKEVLKAMTIPCDH